MKLINLYIENFGGLSHYTLDFEAGLTTVNEPNGFGKTTLAEFIRAMFYGFPRKTKTLDKSLRQKYAPWNGGQYGGNLVFERDGQRYRIERTFGLTPKGDTFTLIELAAGKKITRFPEELGETLFGVDADSFERCVYLPQMRNDGPLATASIQAKLSDLVEDSADVGNYEKAIAALRAKRSALIPYRGSGGSVAETAAKITQLQLQLDEAAAQEEEWISQRAAADQAGYDAQNTEAELIQIRHRLDTATRQEADRLLRQQYGRLQNRHRMASEQLAFVRKKYPKGLPEEQNLHRAEIAAQRLAEYKDGQLYPTAQQLKYCRSLLEELERLQTEICDLQLRAEQIPQQPAAAGSLILLWILGAVGLIGGAALLFAKEIIFSVAAFGIAAAALIGSAVISILRSAKKRAREEKKAALRQQIDTHSRAAEKYRGQMEAVFRQFEIFIGSGGYAAAVSRLEQLTLRNAQMDEERSAAFQQLQRFFTESGLGDTADHQAALKQLREDMLARQSANNLLRELEAQLEDMEISYGESLFAEDSEAADPKLLRMEEQRLQKTLTEARSRMLRAQQSAQQLRQQTEIIPQLREELEVCQNRLAEDRENARILDMTIDFLQQAKDNLATAYLDTIRTRFGYYLAMLEGSDGEKFLIGPDLQVQLERQGQSRELAYFSAGQTDLVMLCMRLALVDALFKEQEIFVILDDPFVNLDDKHIQQARKLLQKLSPHRQILYLTCHSSRIL